MNMKVGRLLSLLLCSYFAFSLSHSMSQEKPSLENAMGKKLNDKQRQHQFLFDEFISGKKCLWNSQKTRLIEIRLDTEKTVASDEVMELPERTEDVVDFFDFLVLRTDSDIKNVKAATLFFGEDRAIRLRKYGFKEGILVFRLPKKRVREGSLSLSLSIESEFEYSEIAIRSKRGVDQDFDELNKWWLTFPKNRFSNVRKAFLNETAKMTYEELNQSLGQNSEPLRKIIVPARLPASGDSISMWGILADRRVSKIHEILSSLDAADAARLAKANFDLEFEAFKEAWEAGTIVPSRRNHAMESQLFLCSEFCSSETVLGELDKWNQWYSSHKPNMNYQFEVRAAPDALLTTSLQMKMLMEKKGFDHRDANNWLDLVIPSKLKTSEIPKLEVKWLMSSDSTPNRPEVIKEIPLFESNYQFMKRGSKQFLLDVLRAELQP